VDWIRARILDELQANTALPERTAKDSRTIYH
jgi:hypothetical protein